MPNTIQEYLAWYSLVWGEETIEDLIDRGFVPIKVIDSAGAVSWKWVYVPDSDSYQAIAENGFLTKATP